MENLIEIKEKFKNGTLGKNGWEIERLIHSKEFFDYWSSAVKYNFEEIEKLVYKHNPTKKPIAFWCIAGGAVGNLVWSFLTETEPVLNDIDVFVWISGSNKKKPEIVCCEKQEEGCFCLRPSENEVYFEDDGVKFLSVARDEKYNIIYKQQGSLARLNGQYSKELKAASFKEFIKTFDYNSCMAYFQPYTKHPQFGFEKPFLQFIMEKQLKIYGFHHPLSTIIRGVKKSKELNAKFDKQRVVEVIAHLFSEIEIEKTHLGEKRKVELSTNPDILEPWFSFDKEKGVFTSLVQKENRKYEHLSKSSVFNFFKLTNHQRENVQYLIDKHFFSWHHLGEMMRQTKVVIPDFNKKTIEKYQEFARIHGFSGLVNPNFINEWINIIKQIYNYSETLDEDGKDLFIGQAEMMLRHVAEVDNYYASNHCGNFDAIVKAYELTIKDDVETLLAEPLVLHDKYKENFKELNTKKDLRVEGRLLRHCVGGYSGIVSSGRSRIFRIRKGEEKATLELGISNQGGDNSYFFNRQLRGPFNAATSKELSDLVEQFINDINRDKS